MKPPAIWLDTFDKQKVLFYALYNHGYTWVGRDVDIDWKRWISSGTAKECPNMFIVNRRTFGANTNSIDTANLGEVMNSAEHFMSYLKRWEASR